MDKFEEGIEKKLGAIERLLYLIVEEKKAEDRIIEEIIEMLIQERMWVKSSTGFRFGEKRQRIDQINIIIEKLNSKKKSNLFAVSTKEARHSSQA